MIQECESLAMCGFFRKHQGTKNLACNGFINQYCKGNKMHECKRKEYRKQHNQPPSDDMMPSGQVIKA